MKASSSKSNACNPRLSRNESIAYGFGHRPLRSFPSATAWNLPTSGWVVTTQRTDDLLEVLMSQTVGDFLVQRLHQWGVRHIFGYPGDGINGGEAAFVRNAPCATPSTKAGRIATGQICLASLDD